jgi:hypothetical protein
MPEPRQHQQPEVRPAGLPAAGACFSPRCDKIEEPLPFKASMLSY